MSDTSPPENGPWASLVERFSEADIPLEAGAFRCIVYRERRTDKEHVALVKGDPSGEGAPVRIHSECLTSEVFGSLKCDCKLQLERSLEIIESEGRGVVIYLRQEGRGIGLGNKIRAYALQNQGLDTYAANHQLGFPNDLRQYDVAIGILKDLKVDSVQLITNNPLKIAALVEQGIPVQRRIPARTQHNPHNVDYLRTKRDQSGHLIDVSDNKGSGSSEAS